MDAIREWFVQHADGDFVIPARDWPFSVIPPASSNEFALYTTKPRCVVQLLSRYSPSHFCSVIGRYGLPSEDDLVWLKSCAGNGPLYFVGDADPGDLLIFSWLRSHLPISFGSINDKLLAACGVELVERITIPQSPAERAALPLVFEHLPDLARLLGSGCSGLLKSGRKVELDALASFASREPLAMVEALCGRSAE